MANDDVDAINKTVINLSLNPKERPYCKSHVLNLYMYTNYTYIYG